MNDSVISQFGLTASDGENIVIMDWSLPSDELPRAVVLIVHGLGEHSWRYQHVARQLNGWGVAVRGIDLYGHGESGGPRGGLPHDKRMLDDLAELVDDTWRLHGPQMPIILLGHSMGGLIAADFVRQSIRPITGLVLSSPALQPYLKAVQRVLLAVVPRIAPNLRLDNGVKPEHLSRSPSVVSDYKSDRLVHRKISARLARYLTRTGPKVIASAPRWSVPTLLLYAGADKVVNPTGSEAFGKAAQKAANSAVKSECFKPFFHEIFNEPERDKVFLVLGRWLAAQIAHNKAINKK